MALVREPACRVCGAAFPADAMFCLRCGAARYPPARRQSLHPGWLVGGLLLPPLWTRIVWEQRWPQALKLLLAAVFALGPAFLGEALFGIGAAATIGIVVLNVIITLLVIAMVAPAQSSSASLEDLRSSVEDKFHACHDLILRLERDPDLEEAPAEIKERYVRALETRSRAAAIFERATTPGEIAQADRGVTEALDSLQELSVPKLKDQSDD